MNIKKYCKYLEKFTFHLSSFFFSTVETETLNEIHHQMNSIETQIFSLENILIEKKCKNSEYENFNIELKADENK